MSAGRPSLDCEVHVIRIALSLRTGEDNDLIQWFESLPPRGRSAAVTAALRSGDGVQAFETETAEVDPAALEMAFSDLTF
ncbi:MAG: hypothetical protein R6X32_05970 [Chloroflexota bacterium]